MKTMSVREFLRGEYKNLDEPTLVMSYSTPLGVWQPVSATALYFTSGSNTLDTEWSHAWSVDASGGDPAE